MIKFENKSNGRYYYLIVEKDIFGDTVINIIRGGDNARVSRFIFCTDASMVREQIRSITLRRIKRGYTLIN